MSPGRFALALLGAIAVGSALGFPIGLALAALKLACH